MEHECRAPGKEKRDRQTERQRETADRQTDRQTEKKKMKLLGTLSDITQFQLRRQQKKWRWFG